MSYKQSESRAQPLGLIVDAATFCLVKSPGRSMALSGIKGRRGPWPLEGLMPQCREMPGKGGGSGWVGEHTHRSRRRGRWDRDFGGTKKGINIWNLNKENIQLKKKRKKSLAA